MAKTTVKDLAADLNLPVETLLSQLKEAGLSQSTPADELSEADKDRFLTSLQVARGSSNAGRRKITLTKRERASSLRTEEVPLTPFKWKCAANAFW